MKLDVKDLTKIYSGQAVLKSLNIKLRDVSSLVVIGPSGGGKSTLLRIIAGLELPDCGEIFVNGEYLSFEEKKLENYRKTVGVVFQAYNLFPHLSAMENITLPLTKVHKLSKNEAQSKAVSLFQRFQLAEHMHKKPHQLSGGQQQRVAIVRAIAIEPKVMLFDEPTSALDPALTSEVLDAILELKREKRNLILVTHEMGFAKHVADYVIFIADGRVVEQGDSVQIFENPQTEELKEFLGKTLKY